MKKFLAILLAAMMALTMTAAVAETAAPAEEKGTIVYGASTEIGGDFAPGAWFTNNATDKMIRDLSNDYRVVVTDQGGAYVINSTVCESIDGVVNEDGTKTFTINPLAASISYATTEVTSSTLNEKITNPLTKTGDGTVAYTSSNTDVATVDATTGEVTVVSGGSTTITATVTPTSNSTYATTTASYTLTVNVYRGLTSVTSDDIGKVICSNKHIHNDINAINCGGVARAMIAYVGNQSVCRCTNGLAYSLEDASYYDSTNKKTVYTFTYGGSTTTPSSTKGALANWSTSLNDSGFGYSIDGGTGTTGVGSAGSCVWRVPSMAEYKYMFAACGGSNYNTTTPSGSGSVSFGYGQFRAKLQALGRDVANDSYWTYQNSPTYVYYTFSSSQFKIGSSSSKYRLRFILAF